MLTPQEKFPKLAKALGLSVSLYLKREDLHQYGSHKGRSIPAMIQKYANEGERNFAVSSSGNAALAAGLYVKEQNESGVDDPLLLDVYVGENIGKEKLKELKEKLENENIKIIQTKRALQTVLQLEKEGKARSLRQSTNNLSLMGYFSLAQELAEISDLSAIFCPTSSGTTAQALGESFGRFVASPQIHVVQTGKCHPIAEIFDKNFKRSEKSTADAIVDIIGHRKNSVEKIIKDSGGFGWVVSDEEIKSAQKTVKEQTGIEISPNSALSIAGLIKATKNDWAWEGPAVCLITGK